ncbi:glycosyltransferase [Cellulomonas cellasea]|uniref:glycosyltransferase n=1 Tax=Cellulomonas cellasea TaxID=43670 RepID=UPI000A81C658|nr:glycosyltransferase [Cellulomonas cellasea]
MLVDGRVLETGSSGVRDVARGLVDALRDRAAGAGDDVVVAGTTSASDLRLDPRAFMEVGLPRAAVRGRFDSILVPRQTRPPLSVVPCVPLVHDVGFVRLPEAYPTGRRIRLTNRVALLSRRALAVSDFTADEVRALGRRRPVDVLPLGAMHDIAWTPAQEDPYLLCTAVHEPHKNLVRLVAAWAATRRHGMRLVLCGRPGRASEELRTAVRAHGVESDVTVVSGLSDADYTRLLAECWAYVQPSLYEGLCIPALDMAAAGVPTAVSSTGNLGAVFGACDVPQTFDPRSTGELVRVLDRLLHDDGHRARVSAWNAAHVSRTDWSAAADVAWGVLS